MTVTLPADSPTIDSSTDLKRGFQLTPNVSLDALTRGVVNPATYPFKTTKTYSLPDAVNPDPLFNSGRALPIPEPWKIAQNLQDLAAAIIEPLIKAYPGDVNLFASFVNPQAISTGSGDITSKHFTGEAVDIILESKAGNMFAVAGDLLALLGSSAVEFGLVFSAKSWIHVGITGRNTVGNPPASQRVFTRDLDSGQYFKGLFPCRGTLVPESQNLNNNTDSVPWGQYGKPPYGML